MGNHRMGHCQTQITLASPRVLKVAVVEIWRQCVRLKVIQSFNTVIPTIRVETIVALATNFVKIGVLIGFVTNLGRGSGGVLARRNLSRSSRIPIAITKIVRTPQMVFTNPKMTTHVNMTAYRPSMNSIIVGRYKSVDARNLAKGYQKPFIVTTRIFDNKKWSLCEAKQGCFEIP